MSVSSTYTPPQYTGDGVTTGFAFGYQFFNLTDLQPNLFDTTANANVAPQPVFNGGATYDYTITATISADTGEYPNATIVFNNAPPANYRITITRALPYTQTSSLTNNAPLPAKLIEARLDWLTLLSQQLLSTTALTLRAPSNDPAGLTYVLPAASIRANLGLGFDASGNLAAAPTTAFPSGAITASSVDTLTNKSIDGGSNTLTNIPGSALTAHAVTNAKAAQMGAKTMKGNITTGTADQADVTVSQLQTLLGLAWTAHVAAANETFTIPAGTTQLIIEAWGAGASGGGGDTAASQRGSGGGGGGYLIKNYTGTMDASLAITVGIGGAAVTAGSGGTIGNAGGNTTVVGTNLGTLTARGGAPGNPGVSSGGLGGTSTNGDLNLTGQDGTTSWSGSTLQAAFPGGDSPRGGRGGHNNVSVAGNAPGGGGSCGNHTGGSQSGPGANGAVMIWYR